MKFFKFVIESFDSKMFSSLNDIIFKLCVNNFIELYVAFLERNDKTVVRVDQNYFKLAKVKTNAKKTVTKSLIQMAKQENFSEKLENYSNEQIEEIIGKYLESK